MLVYRKDLKEKSRELRKEMTDAEQALWFRLRRKQLANVQFFRQRPIGQYIVDFYAPSAKLVVELDGSQHMTEAGGKCDSRRDAYMRVQGIKVLRFDDRQALMETEAVLEVILAHLTRSGE